MFGSTGLVSYNAWRAARILGRYINGLEHWIQRHRRRFVLESGASPRLLHHSLHIQKEHCNFLSLSFLPVFYFEGLFICWLCVI
ncbi:hypothetical protein BDV34DRAFT_196308 [Aspergillus parasiticus]|uniref:Uncharacterized protein n=1 Tax=Aspergillus parasiticus TaxID=5067 RepID=A0A5N6DKD0_ASPPA|nr:hypothetical protein BDV34DRAFT_196308 [Aspergillus parasiticus]